MLNFKCENHDIMFSEIPFHVDKTVKSLQCDPYIGFASVQMLVISNFKSTISKYIVQCYSTCLEKKKQERKLKHNHIGYFSFMIVTTSTTAH